MKSVYHKNKTRIYRVTKSKDETNIPDWIGTARAAWYAVAVDINGDGNLDVVGNSIKGDWKDSIAWFDNFAGKFVKTELMQ